MKPNHTIKAWAARAACLVLAAAIAFLPILYYFAVIDIAFLPRPEWMPQSPDRLYEILGMGGADNPPSTTVPPTTGGITAPPATGGPGTGETKPPSTTEPNSPITLSPIGIGELSAEFTLRRKFVDKLTFEYAYEGAEKQAVYRTAAADRLTVELYMGYILADDGKFVNIYSSAGELIARLPEGYEPAFTRDRDGNPLFAHSTVKEIEYIDDHGNPDTAKVPMDEYFFIDDDGNWTRSDYDDATENRGLYFDYPADYGVAESTTVISVLNKIGVELAPNGTNMIVNNLEYSYTINGYALTAKRYDLAYGFVGGVSFAVDTVDYKGFDTRPLKVGYLISEDGRVICDSQTESNNDVDRYTITSWRAPASFGPESIGSLYFDHGLMRVRLVEIDWYTFYYEWDASRKQKVYSDTDILVNTAGEVLPLPYGYAVEAYSSGMILLSRDGKYGYMDATGAWVIQPDLAGAKPFYGGVAVVEYADGRVAMIDTAGRYVIEPGRYEYISNASCGIVAAYSATAGWSVFTIEE